MKIRILATLILSLTALVFAGGCVADPTTESDESASATDDIGAPEPGAQPEAFAIKCAPDSCGYVCRYFGGHLSCVCLTPDCQIP